MSKWRLILSPPLDGADNMAIDEAILHHGTTPTLRFYSWKSPTLSLGRFQKAEKGLIDRCRLESIDIIRRPTGGRAVLHQHDLSYSVVADYGEFPPPSTLSGIYLTLAKWQLDVLTSLGLNASLGEKRSARAYSKVASCFNSATAYEIHVGGEKISGSAQKRQKEKFIQHGSVLMDVDHNLYSLLLGAKGKNAGGYTTMKDEGYTGSYEEFVSAMIKGFKCTLDVSLEESGLSVKEKESLEGFKKTTFLLD